MVPDTEVYQFLKENDKRRDSITEDLWKKPCCAEDFNAFSDQQFLELLSGWYCPGSLGQSDKGALMWKGLLRYAFLFIQMWLPQSASM